ncbi:hypothetical protein [Helicobacter suis]|uniref:hypothetical protein n=1 Tax=Helicobacter suis TaxID=104628 RepID=UPI0013D6686B|nr:hypothetical protein [Helicobacter suis]
MKIVDELRKENYEYVNTTQEAIDILVSITGCCGEVSTNYYEKTYDSNNYWLEGNRGCSVRIYTTRLNIDMIILGGAGSVQTKRRGGWDWQHPYDFWGYNKSTNRWEKAKSLIDQSREWIENIWEEESHDHGRGWWYVRYRAWVHSWQWGGIENEHNRPVQNGQSSSFVTTLRPGESIKVDFLDNGAKTGYQLSIYSLESNGGVPFDPELLKVFAKATENPTTDTAPTTDKQDSPQVPTENATESTENPTQEQDVKGTNPN